MIRVFTYLYFYIAVLGRWMLLEQRLRGIKPSRSGGRQREKAKASLERRQTLDFLFAAICLVLLREINSPRHTDQYSLNPHLIWPQFPPISPSPPLPAFIFPPVLQFSPIIFGRPAWQPFFTATVQVRRRGREWCFLTRLGKCVCVCLGDVMDKMCRQGPPDAAEID